MPSCSNNVGRRLITAASDGRITAITGSGGVSGPNEVAFEAHIAGWLVEHGGYQIG